MAYSTIMPLVEFNGVIEVVSSCKMAYSGCIELYSGSTALQNGVI